MDRYDQNVCKIMVNFLFSSMMKTNVKNLWINYLRLQNEFLILIINLILISLFDYDNLIIIFK